MPNSGGGPSFPAPPYSFSTVISMDVLVDVTVTCRMNRHENWECLNRCRLRLAGGSMTIEVLDDPGPYCIDTVLKDVSYEVEMSSIGPVLFMTWDNEGSRTTLEIRGESSSIDRLSAALEALIAGPSPVPAQD